MRPARHHRRARHLRIRSARRPQIFAPRGANADIRDLVILPFQHLLTSNYDVALESPHDDLQSRCESLSLCDHAAVDFINNLADYEYGRRVVHVHGRYDGPNNIILTQKEYADSYRRSAAAKTQYLAAHLPQRMRLCDRPEETACVFSCRSREERKMRVLRPPNCGRAP